MSSEKMLTVWVNPQDDHLEIVGEGEEAPSWAETFTVTEEEYHRNLRANNFYLEMLQREMSR